MSTEKFGENFVKKSVFELENLNWTCRNSFLNVRMNDYEVFKLLLKNYWVLSLNVSAALVKTDFCMSAVSFSGDFKKEFLHFAIWGKTLGVVSTKPHVTRSEDQTCKKDKWTISIFQIWSGVFWVAVVKTALYVSTEVFGRKGVSFETRYVGFSHGQPKNFCSRCQNLNRTCS